MWFAITLGVIIIILYLFSNRRKRVLQGQLVPKVKGGVPIMGHALSFGRNPIEFIEECRKTYGNIFQIRLVNRDMIFLCDRKHVKEYFFSSEENISLTDLLRTVGLDVIFTEDPFSDELENQGILVRKVFKSISRETVIQDIYLESLKMVKRMKKKKECNMFIETKHYAIAVVLRCFFSIKVDREFYKLFSDFVTEASKVARSTYMFPKYLVILIHGKTIRKYRHALIPYLLPTIQSYIDNPEKRDSLPLRFLCDSHKIDGSSCSAMDIFGTLLNMIFVGSETTSMSLSNILYDISSSSTRHDDIIKEETGTIDDPYLLSESPLLLSYVYESMRLNSHMVSSTRCAKGQSTLGIYDLKGHTDNPTIAISGYSLMVGENSVFENGTDYYPEQFIKNPKLSSNLNLISWGAGRHACPGQYFARYELTIALSVIMRSMKFIVKDAKPLNRFTFASISSREWTGIPIVYN